MSIFYILLGHQPQTLSKAQAPEHQLNSQIYQTQVENEFISHKHQTEHLEKLQEIKETYYLERRSLW